MAVLKWSIFVSLAWKWWIAPFRVLMASVGSIPCQNRWLGSRFAPMAGPTASRRRRSVRGLYTQKPGCGSRAIWDTPYLAARAVASFQ